MNLPENMREIFNQYQRQSKVSDQVERYVTDQYIRGWMPQYNIGFVPYSALTEENADHVIQEIIGFFKEQGADDFEWKYYDYDTPHDLAQRLVQAGLVPDDKEAVMVLDIATAPGKLLSPVSYDIRKITDADRLQDADFIQQKIWGNVRESVTERVTSMWNEDPDSVSLYIAYMDDLPVSYGRLEFMPSGNPFASIWAGSTLPDYRNRGIYTQLVAIRLQEARVRGYSYLTVDANPDTSMPILQKLGFECFAYTTPYIWTANS